jgi:hypothetical protein
MFQLALVVSLLACVVTSAGCSVLTQKYEYEEEIYLRLDGSALRCVASIFRRIRRRVSTATVFVRCSACPVQNRRD